MFPEELAESLDMRINPTFTSVLLGKLFPSYCGYFKLPADYIDKVSFVIRKLAERGEVFKRKTGRPPCLFIDAVDLLAKDHHDSFIKLVNLAKSHAEAGDLRIVFGCSEGHIVPLINSTSSKSRGEVLKILDLPHDVGISYLHKRGLPDELAKQVIDLAGSRMIFLKHHKSMVRV